MSDQWIVPGPGPGTDAALLEENLSAAEGFARLLNAPQPVLGAEEVGAFAADSGLGTEEAFPLLLDAMLGSRDRRFLERYLKPALCRVQPAEFQDDPYLSGIRFPAAAEGGWAFRKMRYEPYQLFPCGHMRLLPDGREVPRLGYFTEPFEYPAVLEDGREWMTVTPNEILTMRPEIAEARGDVLVLGLGLGYYAMMAARSEAVRSVTVVEQSGRLISLFRRHLLPQFPRADRIRLVQDDAFRYLRDHAPLNGVDHVFADLWHDVGDGLPMYVRLRQLEEACPGVTFRYWIEQDILIFLRGLVLDERLNGTDGPPLLPPDVSATLADLKEAAGRAKL